jgi:hypothetical protein
VEHGGRSGSGAAEDAIEHEGVEMDVHVERRAESLDGRDRPALAVGDALAGRGATEPGEDAADEGNLDITPGWPSTSQVATASATESCEGLGPSFRSGVLSW